MPLLPEKRGQGREGIRGEMLDGRGEEEVVEREREKVRPKRSCATSRCRCVCGETITIHHYGENCGIRSLLTWPQFHLQINCLTSNRRRTLYRKRWARLSSSPQCLTAAPRDNTNLEGNRGVMGCWGGESPERERERRKANRSGWLKFAPLHQRCKDVASHRQHRILTLAAEI